MRLRAIMFAAHPVCVLCHKRAACELDHIIPLHLGGADEQHNMQALCPICHADKTAREAHDRGAG